MVFCWRRGAPHCHNTSASQTEDNGESMRRLLRIIFTTATILSALLVLATAILWIRSQLIIQDLLFYNVRSPEKHSVTAMRLGSLRGEIQFSWSRRVYRSRKYFEYEDPAQYYTSRASFPIDIRPGFSYLMLQPQRTPDSRSFWPRQGFVFDITPAKPTVPGSAPSTRDSGLIGAPHWFLLVIFSLAPAVWIRRRIRAARRGRGPGYCSVCGYDLRATPNQCPECGAVPSSNAPAPSKVLADNQSLNSDTLL